MNLESVAKLSIVELFGLADYYAAAGETATIPVLYRTWIVSHADDPMLHAAYYNYGTVLNAQDDLPGAIMALRESARLKPDFHQARLSLGLVLERIGQPGPAILDWLAVSTDLAAITVEALGHKIMALENVGRVLETLDQDGPAEQALGERLELGFDDKVVKHWIALRARQCKWPVLAASERVKRADLVAGIAPLSLATLADDPLFQLGRAYTYGRDIVGLPPAASVLPEAAPRATGGPIRIGYVSSDLREHAVGFSIVETLELHDRSRFSVTAYYCGIDRDDPTRQRIGRAVDAWVDINGLTDEQAAARIRADGIDILVDLNGYTKDARTRVFALRPAPITVNWFGFPSTMGTSFHHYLIADAVVIPPGDERFYSERVVRLPCYQPNDRRRVVDARPPSRAEEGLPEDAVVYCSLNGLQKLTPDTFERWLGILAAVPASVLWMLAGTPDTQARLRQRAAEAGIAPERLIFAQKRLNPQHVARYALADLFLDHGPYGAHTTAADALWMGLPVLTCPGRSFAARVCASLVAAAGLPELVCRTQEVYAARAIELGLNPGLLAALRARLLAGRATCLLFDTPRLVRELEALYAGMVADHARGERPVPDLANLAIYDAIGQETAFEQAGELDDAAYEALYAARFAEWTLTYPAGRETRIRPREPEPGPHRRAQAVEPLLKAS